MSTFPSSVPPARSVKSARGGRWFVVWILSFSVAWIAGSVLGIRVTQFVSGGYDRAVDRLEDADGLSETLSALLGFQVLGVIEAAVIGFALGLIAPWFFDGRLPNRLLTGVAGALALALAQALGGLGGLLISVVIGVGSVVVGADSAGWEVVVLGSGATVAIVVAVAFATITSIFLANQLPRVEWWFAGIGAGFFLSELPVLIALALDAGVTPIGAMRLLVQPLILAASSAVGWRMAIRSPRSISS